MSAAGGAFSEIACQARVILRTVFEPGVHGTHQYAVGKRRKTEVQRREQVWKRSVHRSKLTHRAQPGNDRPAATHQPCNKGSFHDR